MKSKNFVITAIALTVLLLGGFIGLNVYVDPLFHYHAPNEKLQYPLWDERYMNDGITRHFTYDSIITGSSMTENFKTSQFDNYFGTNSIKVPFSGGTYKEIGDVLKRAFEYNPDIKVVMRSLDSTMLVADKDSLDYNDYPDYLYDSNIFNDVSYVLNKELYLKYTEYVFTFMRLGGVSSTFDSYKNWAGLKSYNGELLKAQHVRSERVEEEKLFLPEDADRMLENLEQNVISLAKEHPDTQFYLFNPPYSILAFDDYYTNGLLNYMMDAWELEAETLLAYDNIHFFSFFDDYTLIQDLNRYSDALHYNQITSNYIIDCMHEGWQELTKENYREYMANIRAYYLNFDYDGLFETGKAE